MAHIIGQPIDRIDGPAKATGAAAYAGDSRAERMAFGSIVTATIGKGRITAIDTAAARALPGVLLVMTHENAPAQAPFQATAEDRHARPKPQLASDKVQYFGEPVALVVAETAEGARAAAQAVTVTYEPAKGAFVLESASHDAYDPKKSGNGSPSDSRVGIFDSAFEISPVRVDAVYRTPYQSHAMMEPHASLASWEGDKLTVRSALQLVESAHKSIADTLKLAPERSRSSPNTSAAASAASCRSMPTPSWRRWRRASSSAPCASCSAASRCSMSRRTVRPRSSGCGWAPSATARSPPSPISRWRRVRGPTSFPNPSSAPRARSMPHPTA